MLDSQQRLVYVYVLAHRIILFFTIFHIRQSVVVNTLTTALLNQRWNHCTLFGKKKCGLCQPGDSPPSPSAL